MSSNSAVIVARRKGTFINDELTEETIATNMKDAKDKESVRGKEIMKQIQAYYGYGVEITDEMIKKYCSEWIISI